MDEQGWVPVKLIAGFKKVSFFLGKYLSDFSLFVLFMMNLAMVICFL